jgi:ligand-binding SRPBCC domain-containing protein
MMTVQQFRKRTFLKVPANEVFRWHARPGALESLTPPWEPVEVVERSGGIEDGSRVTLGVRLGPVCLKWISEHRDYREGEQFRDVQIAGPFKRWEHTHRFEADGPTSCFLEDRIAYALPLGALSHVLAGPFVRRKLERLFRYRHDMTHQDMAAHAAYREE